MKSMQQQIDLLSNQIDISEIAPSQAMGSNGEVGIHCDLISAVEQLAKDIGYGYCKKGIEAALDSSDMSFNNDEAISVVHKASSKIRELRELIENLSKKLCISESGENIKIAQLKSTIEKLKKENKALVQNQTALEDVFSNTISTPKSTVINYTAKSSQGARGRFMIMISLFSLTKRS